MHTQKLMYLWSRKYRDAGKGFFLSEREWLVVLVPLIITITKCGCLLEQTKQIKTQMYSTTWPSLENSMNTMLEPFFFAKNDDRELRFIGTRQKFLDMQSRYKLMDHREARHQLQVLKLQLPKIPQYIHLIKQNPLSIQFAENLRFIMIYIKMVLILSFREGTL